MTTAIVPVAGRGTRLRPATTAIPKEMLPVGGRPVVQHVVEELAASGIERVVFVTAPGKEAIEGHFVGDAGGVRFASVVQPVMRGLGDAVLQADGLVDGTFAVALGDCILGTNEHPPVVARLGAALERHDAVCAIAVRNVPRAQTGRYGIVVAAGDADRDGAVAVSAIVEKPHPDAAPSTLAVSARYAMTPAIFGALREVGAGPRGELELTDAIAALVAAGAPVVALRLGAIARHDIGTHEGYARAFLSFALSDPEHGESLRRYARELLDAG